MKKRTTLTLAMCLLLLSNCAENEAISDKKTSALTVNGVNIDQKSAETRANTVNSIGISRLADAYYSAQTNYNYVYNTTTWKPATPSKEITVSATDATLCTYIPYSATTNLTNMPLVSGIYTEEKDICYGYKSVNNKTNGTGVTIDLGHAYAELTLQLSLDDLFTTDDAKIELIKIEGATSKASLNLSKNPETITGRVPDPILYNSNVIDLKRGTEVNVEFLMIPTTISTGLTFQLTVNGEQKKCTLTADKLGALVKGTNYIIPIKIGIKDVLVLGDKNNNYVKITDWEPPTTIAINTNEYPESNCYMVPRGGTVYIPVSRAEAGNPTNFTKTDAFTTEIVWTEELNLIDPPVQSGRLIKVKANQLEGNVVICAKKNDKIVWSWHIWVVDYNPMTSYMPVVNNHQWMTYNLGGISNAVNTTSTLGLFYQWGRKDPFPRNAVLDGTSEKPLYDKGGNSFTIKKEQVTEAKNLITSIEKPYIFYFNKNGNGDWYSNATNYDNTLWEESKTIYDPCPVGWKVPSSTAMAGFNPALFAWIYRGYRHEETGFYLIASGYRDPSTGEIVNSTETLTYLTYWGADYDALKARLAFYGKSDINMSFTETRPRATGCPIRCVRGF